MSEKSFRLIIFVALLCVAPTIVFLIQVVVTIPPVFILSAVVVLLVEFLKESAGIPILLIAFLAATFLISNGIFWLIAFIFAKIASWLPRVWLRYAWLATLLLVFVESVATTFLWCWWAWPWFVWAYPRYMETRIRV